MVTKGPQATKPVEVRRYGHCLVITFKDGSMLNLPWPSDHTLDFEAIDWSDGKGGWSQWAPGDDEDHPHAATLRNSREAQKSIDRMKSELRECPLQEVKQDTVPSSHYELSGSASDRQRSAYHHCVKALLSEGEILVDSDLKALANILALHGYTLTVEEKPSA